MTGGKMRPLAVLGASRLKRIPEVPTIKEAFPAYNPIPSWFALVGPAALPQPIVVRVHGEVVKALGDAQLSARMTDLGMVPVGSTPDALAAVMKQTMESIGKAVKELGIQPQ
jgi:tripartite-type tricarboxylate transporter receptor subunit TctC